MVARRISPLQRLQSGPDLQIHSGKGARGLSGRLQRGQRQHDGSAGTPVPRAEYKARRVTRTDRNGRIEVLVDRFEGKRFNAPNDIVVRRDGHVYFTDPLYTPLDVRDLDFYGIYHVTPNGRIEAIARMQTRPNGVTLSPDGKILYVGNERKILAYDLDRNGQASNERVIIADLPGGPDGIRTDDKGNLYLTSDGITVYSPAGRLLGRITLPGVARNLAFGDKDLRTLYMIGNSLYRVRVPIPGSIQY